MPHVRLLKGGLFAIGGAIALALVVSRPLAQGREQDLSLVRVHQRQKSILLQQNRIQEAAAVDGHVSVSLKRPQATVESLAELVSATPYILIGTFRKGIGKAAPFDVVLTEYSFDVDEVLKSPNVLEEKQLSFVIPGGRAIFADGSSASVVTQFLMPLEGQRFVVFARREDEAPNLRLVFRPVLPAWSLYELAANNRVIPHSASIGLANQVRSMDALSFVRMIREDLKQ